jgi:hypothetical protein
MRNLWIRIGLGAAFVFAAGMFVVTLGRQVKNSIVSTVDQGGSFRVPFSFLPFRIDHEKVGHIQEVDVQKGSEGLEHINLTVRLKHEFDADRYANCLFVLDSPHTQGMFSCMPEGAEAEADYVRVGELRIHPGDVVRPIVIARHQAEEWFDSSDLEQVKISTTDGGAVIKVTDAEGTRVVDLTANAGGARIKVRDADGKEVVNMQAGGKGLQLDVKESKKQ